MGLGVHQCTFWVVHCCNHKMLCIMEAARFTKKTFQCISEEILQNKLDHGTIQHLTQKLWRTWGTLYVFVSEINMHINTQHKEKININVTSCAVVPLPHQIPVLFSVFFASVSTFNEVPCRTLDSSAFVMWGSDDQVLFISQAMRLQQANLWYPSSSGRSRPAETSRSSFLSSQHCSLAVELAVQRGHSCPRYLALSALQTAKWLFALLHSSPLVECTDRERV